MLDLQPRLRADRRLRYASSSIRAMFQYNEPENNTRTWKSVTHVPRRFCYLSPRPVKVVVTCSMPMNEDNTELVVAHTSSGAEELAKRIPKARVVAAFGTVPSEVFFDVYEARRKAKRPSLLYCGDDRRGKDVAARLIRDVGFDPVDAGPLRIARYTEPFTMLIAQLAYEGEGGPELAYRFERFGK